MRESSVTAAVDEVGNIIKRQLCKWPARPNHMGIGDPKKSSSWGYGGDKRVKNCIRTEE